MPKPKKNDRGADDRALNSAGKKQDPDDRVLNLGKLIGRKPPNPKGGKK